MSLLMDALKKAEEAKRQASEGGNVLETSPTPAPPAPTTPSAPAELQLEPVAAKPAAASAGSALPTLSQHIESVDADLAAVPTTAPSKKRPAPPAQASATKPVDKGIDSKDAAERNAVRNVFAVKQAPKSRTPLWLFLGLAGSAMVGGGAYFWWQLQSMSGNSLARPAAPTQPPHSMASVQNQPTSSPTPAAPAEVRKSEPLLLPPLPEATRHQALVSAPLPEKREPQKSATSSSATAEPDSPGPIRLSASRLKQDPTLNRAYEALLADNLNDARRDYEQVLRNDPKNTDALLGIATIAARLGQTDRAAALYLRVLEADPKDVNAKAGLINLKGQSDPTLSESRLKTLLASQPDSAPLNFALGNLHAREARWSDAQQAYFRAYTAEPENADYLFNLAVSLDHLRQKNLAAQYYQMALNAAGPRSTAFDKAQVRSRLLELQP